MFLPQASCEIRLKEMCSSCFCEIPKNQALHKSAPRFLKQLKKY